MVTDFKIQPAHDQIVRKCLREWSNVSAVPIEKDHPVASDCTNDMVNANQRSNGLHSVYFDVQTLSTQTSP